MNTKMADGAARRLVAQIGEALFGQPGLDLIEIANRCVAERSRFGFEPILHSSIFDACGDELNHLRADMSQIAGCLPGVYYMDPPDGGNVSIPEQVRRMAEDAAQHRHAAQPSPAGHNDALVDTARRNIRQFISKASFSSSVDKQAALSCVDVLEAALADRQPMAAAVKNSLTVGGEPITAPNRLTDQAQAVDLGTGVKAIAAERQRQMQAEGFTRDADQQYRRGELARAATAYVQLAAMDLRDGGRDHIAWHGPAAAWPWAPEWWKPVDARRDLVRAGALIAAQIDLIDSKAVGNG